MNKANVDSNFQKAIDAFDFKIVHEIMDMLDWKWSTKKGYKVPSQAEMIESVMELYKSCNFVGRISTGGFEIEIEDDDTVVISFIAHQSMWMTEFNQTDGKVVENDF